MESADPINPAVKLYSDHDAATASGVSLPCLRLLQTSGVIQAVLRPKHHGGFHRRWREIDVLKASIASAMSHHYAWGIRLVASAMSETRPDVWTALVDESFDVTDTFLPRLELINRAFLTAHHAKAKGDAILLGRVALGAFISTSSESEQLGSTIFPTSAKCISMATINVSVAVRMAATKLSRNSVS